MRSERPDVGAVSIVLRPKSGLFSANADRIRAAMIEPERPAT
jgi:hypothetical protein